MSGSILLPCAYRQLLGFSCPMCGFQRSVLLVADGRVWDGICRFPPMVAIAVVLLFLTIKLLMGERAHNWPVKWTWWLLLTAFLFNLIYQNAIE